MQQGAFVRGMVAAVLPVVLLGGCGDGPSGPGIGAFMDLARARERWADARIDDYAFTLVRSCFCFSPGRVRVTVVDGAVTSVVPDDGGPPLPPSEAQWYPSIAQLFDTVGEAISSDAHYLEARYDAARGFPLLVAIDWRKMVADDEITYWVSDLTITP